MWPLTGIDPLIPFSVPLLNRAIDLSSGATVTWTHHSIVSRQKSEAISGLTVTVILQSTFTGLQVWNIQRLLYNSRFCLRNNILCSNGISRFTFNYWNHFVVSLLNDISFVSFYKISSLWIWSSFLILTLCRYCMAVLICLHLLMRMLIAQGTAE